MTWVTALLAKAGWGTANTNRPLGRTAAAAARKRGAISGMSISAMLQTTASNSPPPSATSCVLVGGVGQPVVDLLAAHRGASAGELQEAGAEIGGDDARPEPRQTPGEDAVATGDIEHPLARPHRQQPLHRRPDQDQLERVALAHPSVPELGFALPDRLGLRHQRMTSAGVLLLGHR